MNFIADENIDKQIVDRLRSDGHSVLYVFEMDPGISDDQVLEIANKSNALLITADTDFGELIYRLNVDINRSAGGTSASSHGLQSKQQV